MSRFARRVDANHSEIVDAYEKMGVAVLDLSKVAELTKPGCPDLLCSLHGYTWLSETKTEDGDLNDAQKHFISLWKGDVHVVRTVGEVVKVVSIYKAFVKAGPQRAR